MEMTEDRHAAGAAALCAAGVHRTSHNDFAAEGCDVEVSLRCDEPVATLVVRFPNGQRLRVYDVPVSWLVDELSESAARD